MANLDWRTVRELMALRARLRELVERVVLPDAAPASGGTPSPECPVDVWENDTEVVVEIEVPGASAANVEARIEGDALVVSGELPVPPDEGDNYLFIERYRGPFRRVVALPAAVSNTPVATLRSGVLEVRLPKEQPLRRRIAVATERS